MHEDVVISLDDVKVLSVTDASSQIIGSSDEKTVRSLSRVPPKGDDAEKMMDLAPSSNPPTRAILYFRI